MSATPNRDQAEYWASAPGEKWVKHQEKLDALLAPVLARLLEEARLAPGERVLDIGCGTGASTLAAAEQVGRQGAVLGADISPPMLTRAKARAEAAGIGQASFLEADVQAHPFEPASFDATISRFGVMFFADPVAAFANVATALREGGRVAFMAWAGLKENPWFSVPRAAAIERLGAPPPGDPRAPGPMAFAEADYAVGLLEAAGLKDVSATPVSLDLTPTGTLDEVAKFSAYLGPAVRILQEMGGTKEDAAAIAQAVRVEFEPYRTETGLRVPAVLNLLTARA
ncbi:MAG: class I SAM-dependent methyltransferase [Roseovarius sp.]